MASYVVFILAITIACCTAQAYIQQSLSQHNAYRANHGSHALKIDRKLNKKATKCAKYYSRKGENDHTCPFKKGEGENLDFYMSTAGAPTESLAAQQAMDDWYKEETNYNYENPGQSTPQYLHFTQLVWKNTTKMGIASYRNTTSKTTYTCALYTAAGNVLLGGEGVDKYQFFKENVQRPK